MNVGGLRTLDSQIGVYLDDEFIISDECLGEIRSSYLSSSDNDERTVVQSTHRYIFISYLQRR